MLTKFFKFCEKNFGLLLVIFGSLAFIYPKTFSWGESFTDEALMIGLFLGFLKIDFSELLHLKNNLGKMLIFVLISLILVPFSFFLVSAQLDSEIRLGVFLLLAVSGALMTPLLASILKLKILWSAVFMILTSILLPISMPFLIKALFAIEVEIPTTKMIFFLAKIIFIPLLLAVTVKKIAPKLVKATMPYYSFLGIIVTISFLGALIAANQKALAENIFKAESIFILLLLFLATAYRYMVGYFMPHQNKNEKWTNSFMFGTANNGIVILLSAQFFSEKVLFILLLSEIPWTIAQPIFQKLLALNSRRF